MPKNISPQLAVLLAITFVCVGLWLFDIWRDHQIEIVIRRPVKIYSEADASAYGKQDLSVATIEPNTSVKVVRMKYGKDYQAFLVQTNSGQKGWLVNNENISVLAPESR